MRPSYAEKLSIPVPDQWYWLPDEKEVFVLARLTHDGENENGQMVLETKAGERVTIDESAFADIEAACPAELTKIAPDITELSDNSRGAILEIMKNNYLADNIWINVAGVLVVVNPFKRVVPLKGKTDEEIMEAYNCGLKGLHKLPCCIFKTVQLSRIHGKQYGANGSIVIMGDSGSGKTFGTRTILKFLAHLNKNSQISDIETVDIAQQMVSMAPITEAFGNCKTIMNDNSSRFGCWLEVVYSADIREEICGVRMTTYLLDKPRVVFQKKGERNFNIFFMILSGSPQFLSMKAIKDPSFFKSLGQSPIPRDHDNFIEMVKGFSSFGFHENQQQDLFKAIMGIAYLGNVEFEGQADLYSHTKVASISDEAEAHLSAAANLFGVDKLELARSLTEKPFTMPTGEIVVQPLNVASANDIRKTTCQWLYGKIFRAIISFLNIKLMKNAPFKHKTFGILDIFGFENLETNVLEQILINHANERLQEQFNKIVVDSDKRLFATEGIPSDGVDFVGKVDYAPALNVVVSKKRGLVRMLGAECSLPNGGSVSNLMLNLEKKLQKNVAFRKGGKENTFFVNHFAGEVLYDATTMIEGSKHKTMNHLVPMFYKSTNPFLGGDDGVFASLEEETHVSTVGEMFLEDLKNLRGEIEATVPSYVKCITPNGNKAEREWDAPKVYRQCIAGGLFSVIRLRREGFIHRTTIEFFTLRYKVLASRKKGESAKDWILRMLEKCRVRIEAVTERKMEEDVKIGKNIVFYRPAVEHELEKARAILLEKVFALSRSYIEGAIARKGMRKLRDFDASIKAIKKSKSIRKFWPLLEKFKESNNALNQEFGLDTVWFMETAEKMWNHEKPAFTEVYQIVDKATTRIGNIMATRVGLIDLPGCIQKIQKICDELRECRWLREFEHLPVHIKKLWHLTEKINEISTSGQEFRLQPLKVLIVPEPDHSESCRITFATEQPFLFELSLNEVDMITKYNAHLFDKLDLHDSVSSLPWDLDLGIEGRFDDSSNLRAFEEKVYSRCEVQLRGTWSSRFIQRRAKPKMVKALFKRRCSLLEIWENEDYLCWRIRELAYRRVYERLKENCKSTSLLRNIFVSMKRFDLSKYHEHISRISDHFQLIVKNFCSNPKMVQNYVYFTRFCALTLKIPKVFEAIKRREGPSGLNMFHRPKGIHFSKTVNKCPFMKNHANALFHKKTELFKMNCTVVKMWHDLDNLNKLQDAMILNFKKSAEASEKEARFWRRLVAKVFRQLNSSFGHISRNPIEKAASKGINFLASCSQLRNHTKRQSRSRNQLRRMFLDNWSALKDLDAFGQSMVGVFISEVWEDLKDIKKADFVKACGLFSELKPIQEFSSESIMSDCRASIGKIAYGIRTYCQGEIPSVNILLERQLVISGTVQVEESTLGLMKDWSGTDQMAKIRKKIKGSVRAVHTIMRGLGYAFKRHSTDAPKTDEDRIEEARFAGSSKVKRFPSDAAPPREKLGSTVFDSGKSPNEEYMEHHHSPIHEKKGHTQLTDEIEMFVDLVPHHHRKLTHVRHTKDHKFAVVTKQNHLHFFKSSLDPLPELTVNIHHIQDIAFEQSDIIIKFRQKRIQFRIGAVKGRRGNNSDVLAWYKAIRGLMTRPRRR